MWQAMLHRPRATRDFPLATKASSILGRPRAQELVRRLPRSFLQEVACELPSNRATRAKRAARPRATGEATTPPWRKSKTRWRAAAGARCNKTTMIAARARRTIPRMDVSNAAGNHSAAADAINGIVSSVFMPALVFGYLPSSRASSTRLRKRSSCSSVTPDSRVEK